MRPTFRPCHVSTFISRASNRSSRKLFLQPFLLSHSDPKNVVRSPAFSLSAVSPIILAPTIFTGLVITLWAYKCAMLVLFQNKIIYMPSVPPFSRSEKIEDYERRCKPVTWREENITSADGTRIALMRGEVDKGYTRGSTEEAENSPRRRRIVVVYFQGNASSLPPRLPYLSEVLKLLQQDSFGGGTSPTYSIVAVSYRGFWKSKGRPSQRGIELDAAAALDWTMEQSAADGSNLKLILWGQSIGAGVATAAAARRLHMGTLGFRSSQDFNIAALLLETPFLNIRQMLTALYPQKWLPYRHLWPFLRNHWDNVEALEVIASSQTRKPEVLILQAGKDEIVPPEHGMKLESVCKSCHLKVRREEVDGALHTEVVAMHSGRQKIARFLREMGSIDSCD